MHDDDIKTDAQRRNLVKLAAGGAVMLPLAGLVACSGGDDGKSAAEKVSDAADAAADKAASAADSVAGAASDAADAAGDMAGDAMDKAGDMASDAKDAAGNAMDKAGEMAGDAKDAAGNAMDKAGDMASDAADATKDAAEGAMDAAGDAVDSAKDKAGEMMDDAAGAVTGTAGGLPKLQESDPVAQALGYKHDASAIDTDKYPNRGKSANEACSNCALFVAGNGGWGACSIFAGKAVNANGWCASYNRKAG